MLKIQQFLKEPSTIYDVSNSDERSSKKLQNEIQINFSNDEFATYNKDRLLELDFFKHNSNLNSIQFMTSLSLRNFNAIIGIIIDKKQLSDVFALEDYSNVFLYEDLIEGIKLLHPSSSEPLIENLKKNYFPYLTLNQAKKIIHSYQNMMKEDDAVPLAVVPLAVSIAENYLLMVNAFSNEEEASMHFDSMLYYQMEINLSQIIIDKLKQCSLRDTCEARLSSLKASNLTEWVKSCEKKLEPLLKMMDPNTMSMMGRQNFLRLLKCEDPVKQAIATKAQEELIAYKKTITKLLESFNADMSRHDLLSFLIGPDAFLFDEYNICYLQKFSDDDRWCMLRTHSTFTNISNYSRKVVYSLQDTGPYTLEEDIRNDWLRSIPLSLSKNDIPDRIVKERIITKKIPDEVKDFQLISIPIFKNWKNCSNDDVITVKNGIISLNGLSDLITHSDLKLTIPSGSDLQTIKGSISLKSYRRPFEIDIDDFLMKIDNHIPNANRRIIESMKTGEYRPPSIQQTSQFYTRG